MSIGATVSCHRARVASAWIDRYGLCIASTWTNALVAWVCTAILVSSIPFPSTRTHCTNYIVSSIPFPSSSDLSLPHSLPTSLPLFLPSLLHLPFSRVPRKNFGMPTSETWLLQIRQDPTPFGRTSIRSHGTTRARIPVHVRSRCPVTVFVRMYVRMCTRALNELRKEACESVFVCARL